MTNKLSNNNPSQKFYKRQPLKEVLKKLMNELKNSRSWKFLIIC